MYKQVCKACHSLQYIAFRNLIGVSHTEDEAKAEAEEVSIALIIISNNNDQIVSFDKKGILL